MLMHARWGWGRGAARGAVSNCALPVPKGPNLALRGFAVPLRPASIHGTPQSEAPCCCQEGAALRPLRIPAP